MGFIRFVGSSPRDNRWALGLFLGFALYYGASNIPFLLYIKDHAALLAAYNPFYGAAYPLNLFNFDPSMYYGTGNASVIHPFLNFISGPLARAAGHAGGNGFFLAVQSLLNAAGVAMMFYYLRRSGSDLLLSLAVAGFFGASSYALFTAMIPDSYPYAQFVLLLSVLYLLYSRTAERTGGWQEASLMLVNFGVTSTNMVPFAGALLVNKLRRGDRRVMLRLASIGLGFVVLAAGFTGLQWLIFGGKTWVSNWVQSLDNGGFRYAAPFVWSEHWKAVYMLVISPVLTPDIVLGDPGIAAFVTDLAQPYPFHVSLVGLALIALAAAGFIRGIRTREVWILACFIGFGAALHLVKGYGLAVFKYDLYLYAGHYLFAFFLLAAAGIRLVRHPALRRGLTVAAAVLMLVTWVNNAVMHTKALDRIEQSYAELERSGTKGK